jgi:hypothetical protein
LLIDNRDNNTQKTNKNRFYFLIFLIAVFLHLNCRNVAAQTDSSNSVSSALKESFKTPPPSSFPGVYWYFMDGNLSREAMDGRAHPGLKRRKGHIGFLGHGNRVEFRNIQFKELK